MQRYFITLSYDGTDFFGWQIQPTCISVQEVIQQALSKLHSNQEISIVGCGRTDTGVHAHHYVLHVDLPEIKDSAKFIFKLNRMLPDSVALQAVQAVSNEMHARFSATARTYRYFVHNTKAPFQRHYSWYLPQRLHLEAMNEAAKHLLGTQDFTSFSKVNTEVKTNICTVTHAEWVQNDTGYYFEITADRFLRNMVRATVGTLVDVGLGKIQTGDLPKILAAKDRGAASTSVPAQGLFLWKIEYDGLQKSE